MKYQIMFILVFIHLIISGISAQVTPVDKGLKSITPDVIRAQLGFLASDWMEGREAGEKGEYLAADYIASMLQLYGIKPGGDYIHLSGTGMNSEENERTYFQNFVLLKTVPGDEQLLKIKSAGEQMTRSVNLTYNVDFTFRTSDKAFETEAPVVFAGYGYFNDSLGYNDFNKLDIRGKYILKITGLPKFLKVNGDREKAARIKSAMEARYLELGATGILEFDPDSPVVGIPQKKDFGNMSPAEGVPQQGKPNARYSIPGKKYPDNLIKILVSVKSANEILNGTGINLEDYIARADKNEKYNIPDLKGKSIYLKTSVITSQVAVRNILGIIEGKNPGSYILLGAHYDHIGLGNGYIWNGADDNGSGTVGVLTIAKAAMATDTKPENSIIFAFWTAEEEGLLGSRYYVRNPELALSGLKLNMNFDMISRYISDDQPKSVTMTYTNSFPRFREITAENLEKYRIDLLVDYQPSANPPGGTDHRSFVEAGIPIIRFKSGHREEYHTPGDETGTVDWDIMEKIIRICFADTWDLANEKW